MYQDKHRPQFHFSPPAHWMNDPNGMVYFEGEYHLFYQYYPEATVWGPMHWGHAVSKDMVHWEHLPIALYPDSLGYIFSGSVVVDLKNTSGFGKNGAPPLVAMYTYHHMEKEKAGRLDFQYQAIAYSNDQGRTWTKYAGNPVIPNVNKIRDFRDPKVRWDPVSEQWVLVFAAYDQVQFWGSKDLKKWTHLSDFGKDEGAHGGVWECPDLFPLGDKWVLLVSINPGAPNSGSGTQYFIGHFDGKSFRPDPEFSGKPDGIWLDYGRDNYAGVTWSDIPARDGRRLFLGWMSNWDYAQAVPTDRWRSAMTLPRELTLVNTGAGARIASRPVKELERLRQHHKVLESGTIHSIGKTVRLPEGVLPNQLELDMEFDLQQSSAASFGIELSNKKGETYRLGYDLRNSRYFSDRRSAGPHRFSDKFATQPHTAPRISTNPALHWHILLDAASVESFADDGLSVLTDTYFPSEDFTRIRFFSDGGDVVLKKGALWGLKSIWSH
jgi:fructan beta-fructosidase